MNVSSVQEKADCSLVLVRCNSMYGTVCTVLVCAALHVLCGGVLGNHLVEKKSVTMLLLQRHALNSFSAKVHGVRKFKLHHLLLDKLRP